MTPRFTPVADVDRQCDPVAVNSTAAVPRPLETFINPMLDLPAWGVRQGHGSFLTFDFGEPKLEVTERLSAEKGLRRSAFVRGEWHLWIYCCHWMVLEDGEQLASSEDGETLIARATATLNGQKLLGISVEPNGARSTFTFDLGGSLETRPYGGDPLEEQWMILTQTEAFKYRADGSYFRGPSNTPSDKLRWSPLR